MLVHKLKLLKLAFYVEPLISPNQNPEQLVRDRVDKMLVASGWLVQSKKQINLAAGVGVAVREYQTDIGPAAKE